MSMQSQHQRNGSAGTVTELAVALAAFLVVSSCGGSGDGVSIGTGQDQDPVVVDFPIAFVKAPVPLDDQGVLEQSDVREIIRFNIGADLYFRDRASPSAADVNITDRELMGLGDVRDVEIAYDGSTLLFAMRGPADTNLALDDENQPTWNIWEYEFATDELRRVISSPLTAEIGHDVAPHYLPDGRIIFSSTRQVRSNAILTDEGKPQFAALDEDRNEMAFVLHVMSADGSNIEQVSYNQSHDFDPSVLSNGQIVFSRWDNAAVNNSVNLYRMNPDGSKLELLYGQNSHDTGTNGEIIQFMQPRELEDGRIMALVRPFTDTAGGGDIFVIDTPVYLENTQPNKDNPGMPGPAQQAATINNVSTLAGVPSRGGRYSSVFPIQDGTGRMIVSWSQCRVIENLLAVPCTDARLADPQVEEAPPVYGIWIYDPRDNTQLPVVPPEAGFIFPEVVAADPRTTPPVILDGANDFTMDPNLVANDGVGVLHIRSVYDFDGAAVANIAALADPGQTTADQRPARFLRLVKAVSLPDEDVRDFDDTAFGRSAQQGMKEILAYAPVEPDGSVMIKVPANVAFAVSVLDANGRRITARHQNWMQVRPMQLLECNGCHIAQSGISHGRGDAFDSAWAGVQSGSGFPNTDQAMLVENLGDTMAWTRAYNSCSNDNCSSLEPSINVEFTDVWTDEAAAGRMKDPDISYRYAGPGGLTTPAPLSQASDFCLNQAWTSRCRIVINYPVHLQPLWDTTRPILDAGGNQILDPDTGLPIENCVGCHSTIDGAGLTRVPAGQLDLTGQPSPDEADHLISYRELLFPDNEQELNMGALQDRLVDSGQVDANGDPILVTVTVNPSMNVAGANASNRFFSRFDGGSHDGYLSDAEKRLIAEWLDVGAQYYNSPFDVPIN